MICKNCNKDFDRVHANRLYCSNVCKNRLAHSIRGQRNAPKIDSILLKNNIINNIHPLAGDLIRLSNDIGDLKAGSLGIIVGNISEKNNSIDIVINPILPPYINSSKELNCNGGTRLTINKDNLLHNGTINNVYYYTKSKRADELILVNNYLTFL